MTKKLIYFSSIPYDSYLQRPHFLIRELMAGGFDRIMWVDPYPTRLPSLSDLRRPDAAAPFTTRPADGRIEVLRPRALPIEPLPFGGIVNRHLFWRQVSERLRLFAEGDDCVIGVGRPSVLARWALDHVPHRTSFIDVLDNFPAFYRGISRRSMQRQLTDTLSRVERVYCSSTQLADEVNPTRRDAVIVLNGYSTERLPPPGEQAARRYVGYVGTIGNWFDWPLVVSLARQLPDITVRLIGPEFVPRPSDLPSNIELLGEKPHGKITGYVQEFAVGLIPFAIDELTEGVDPIKFYEYRSLGVPVWSTRFGEMRARGAEDGVIHIDRQCDWRQLWKDAGMNRLDPDEIARFRSAISWQKRLAPIVQDLR